MKVALGTVELSDDVLKSIRRSEGKNGKASREEARSWLLGRITDVQDQAIDEFPPNRRPQKVVAFAG